MQSDTQEKCAMSDLKDRVVLKLQFKTSNNEIELFNNSRYVKALKILILILICLHSK